MYLIVCDQAEALISLLTKNQTEYLALDDEGRKQYYYGKRDEFNNLIVTGESKSGIKSAALFIFLNRTCFNGLYRANRNGLFNVPKGDQANPLICNEENIRAVSAALAKVQIVCGDYSASKAFIDKNTLLNNGEHLRTSGLQLEADFG